MQRRRRPWCLCIVDGACVSLQTVPEPASSETSPVSYGEANLFFMGESTTGV